MSARRLRYAMPKKLPTGIRSRAKWPDENPMNKTEEAYAAEVLDPDYRSLRIIWHSFEPIKLRLGRSNFYTPDFMVITDQYHIEIHEIKAMWSTKDGERVGWEEDARQKVRDAAENYPFWRFRVCAMRSTKLMKRDGSERWAYEDIRVFNGKPPIATATGGQPMERTRTPQ